MKSYYVIGALSLFSSLYGLLPQRVIICGVCKDVEKRLPHSIKIMETIGQLFTDYRIIVYENNSKDQTPKLLEQWAFANIKVRVFSEVLSDNDMDQLFVHRSHDPSLNNAIFPPEAIARARNIVLDQIWSQEYEAFKYVIWMDMDFYLEPDYDGITEVFESCQEWDAVFAYGIDPHGFYWDWYALRHAVAPLGPELLGNQWWPLPKKMSLTRADEWYPVLSSFGGCGIYKKSSLRGSCYSCFVTETMAHVYNNILLANQSSSDALLYYEGIRQAHIKELAAPCKDASDCKDESLGIRLNKSSPIVWRMNSFVYKFPVVCEHVALHFSMICKGYTKLYINPRLIFRYSSHP